MMDREQFDRWLEREAERIEQAHAQQRNVRWSHYVAAMQEFSALPVSAEVEAFCESTMRRKP